MTSASQIAKRVDRLSLECRIRDLAMMGDTHPGERLAFMVEVFRRLGPGGYLVGCGPYNCGLLPLSVESVVLGRPASPLEAAPGRIVDYSLNDAVGLRPREASRVHASISLRDSERGDREFVLVDEESSCGTYLNGEPIMPRHEMPLTTGDVISLGASGVNSFVFVDTTDLVDGV